MGVEFKMNILNLMVENYKRVYDLFRELKTSCLQISNSPILTVDLEYIALKNIIDDEKMNQFLNRYIIVSEANYNVAFENKVNFYRYLIRMRYRFVDEITELLTFADFIQDCDLDDRTEYEITKEIYSVIKIIENVIKLIENLLPIDLTL